MLADDLMLIDKCFASVRLLPPLAKVASAFCSPYIKFTPTVTQTPTPIKTVAVTVSPTCTTIVNPAAEFPTVVDYPTRAAQLDKRAAASTPTLPASLVTGCGTGQALTAKISSACSCYLGTTKTVIADPTSTVTTTATACQTATSGEQPTCGIPVSTYTTGAKITCTAAGASPQETVARFRIEGGSEGTIYEGCLAAGPGSITTPSGGTQNCDGTNNAAHPSPGGTLTRALNAAAALNGFGFDGSYDNSFQDFFISSISASTQTSTQFWGLLRNFQFPSGFGCAEYNSPGEGLWAFDAFNKNAFLALSIDYAVVRPGETVSLTITDGQSSSPASGATFAGQTSGADGKVTFTAPLTKGCYQYKATRVDAIRSPAFYLTVM